LAALGDARTVLNVGAGTGSYEPADRYVLAVEPSALMPSQRPIGAAPCLIGSAEHLPFDDQTFDAAMAFATIQHRFWLTCDYLPDVAGLIAGRPSPAELAAAIGARTEPVLIPWDCVDGFFDAGPTATATSPALTRRSSACGC
jgi:hypothetical protein